MNRPAASRYIHGTSRREQDRLSALNQLINMSSLREMNASPGDRILDVGSGLGQFTRMMARTVQRTVTGIERDTDQIAACRQLASDESESPLLDIREGDVQAFPLRKEEWGSFDLAHARFVLEHVSDPGAVVSNMVRAVRPGGRIILEDDDHDLLRLWPDPPGAAAAWDAYCRSFSTLGNDPAIGRKLPALIALAGGRPVRATWIFFGACAGQPEFTLYADNMMGLLDGARSHILQAGLIDEARFDNGISSLAEWKKKPDATIWYARAWAEGARPEHTEF